jgi:dTDP-4-dehydrorhamnose reductase
LGQEVVRQAVDSGSFQSVWGTRLTREIPMRGVRPVVLDITNPAAVFQLVGDVLPQVIIHTAYDKRDEYLDPVTVGGTRHVAQAAATVGARLVHVSSDLVLDGEHAPYDESAEPAPVHPYGRAKAEAEMIVRREMPTAAIVRTSLICRLDPLDPASAWLVDSLRQPRPITLFTDELRNPVWLEDLAAALLELSQSGYAGRINVAGPQALSRYELGTRLSACFGLDPSGIIAGLSRDSGQVRPRDCRLDTSLAQRLLSTRLRGFDQGLRDYAR